jgi:hypothetical protein
LIDRIGMDLPNDGPATGLQPRQPNVGTLGRMADGRVACVERCWAIMHGRTRGLLERHDCREAWSLALKARPLGLPARRKPQGRLDAAVADVDYYQRRFTMVNIRHSLVNVHSASFILSRVAKHDKLLARGRPANPSKGIATS